MLQGNNVTEERRADERLLVRCPVKFKTEKEEWLRQASAKDLSDKGIGFFSHSRVEPNSQLELWLNLLPELKTLHLRGRVIWSKQGTAQLWRSGVRFAEDSVFTKAMRMLLNRQV